MTIDLRSDTVTVPTDEMRFAMADAVVGDDVYGEDPTVNELEEYAAALVGKEAALFVPSGTMGNQIALMVHTARGEEVICDKDAHVFYYENAGAAALSACQLRTVEHEYGIIRPEVFLAAIRKRDLHVPRSSVLGLENSHNRGGGVCYSADEVRRLSTLAHEHGMAVHCDGARIFNAAAYLAVDVKRLTQSVDSVMFCLSKGLGAPVGSVLAGSAEFIARARQMRKLLGGGMRQAGIIAAAGLVALHSMRDRLPEDHEHARNVAEALAVAGVKIDKTKVQTNILLFDVRPFFNTATECVCALRQHSLLASAFSDTVVRWVFHKDVSRQHLDAIPAIIAAVFNK